MEITGFCHYKWYSIFVTLHFLVVNPILDIHWAKTGTCHENSFQSHTGSIPAGIPKASILLAIYFQGKHIIESQKMKVFNSSVGDRIVLNSLLFIDLLKKIFEILINSKAFYAFFNLRSTKRLKNNWQPSLLSQVAMGITIIAVKVWAQVL